MEANKQNHQKNHVFIVTSDDADAGVKQFRIKSWVVRTAVIIVCVLIGAALGYVIYEEQIWDRANSKIDEYKKTVETLEKNLEDLEVQKTELASEYEKEIQGLNDKLTIMSETINQKVVEVEELTAQIEAMYQPTRLPITGSVTIEEVNEGDPMCIFYASEGAMVIATASGSVTELVEEATGEFRVVIDHGNGYTTIYRNQSAPKVKFGDMITQGDTVFVIDVVNTKFSYQVMQDDVYIDPMTMMQISG